MERILLRDLKFCWIRK